MIRYAVIIVNILVLFIYQLFFADGVTVSQSVPSDILPGNDYTVEVTINKGTVAGFAKLQQELPAGCTASPVDSKTASFSMSGNLVKFIWTSLPSDPVFTISYKISVSSSATPSQNVLGGKFYYVQDNVKQSVDIPSSNFNIGGSSTSAAPPAKDTTSQTAVVAPVAPTASVTPVEPTAPVAATSPIAPTTSADETIAVTNGSVFCSRKISFNAPGDYTVEVTIVRGALTGFAKLQENIPPGYQASSLQSSGASFSFNDQKVKMVWINLPTDAEIKVSYKITGAAAANGEVEGVFSYIENEETKKCLIPVSEIPSGTGVPANAEVKTEPGASAGAQVKTESGTQVKTETAAETKKEPAAEVRADKINESINSPKVRSAQASVNYKVQVCALRKTAVGSSYFSNRYGLTVDQELHEGWTKYTVTGGFNEYRPARDFREKVRNKGVMNPFITAYNSGKRITVQEALMITSQKWYP